MEIWFKVVEEVSRSHTDGQLFRSVINDLVPNIVNQIVHSVYFEFRFCFWVIFIMLAMFYIDHIVNIVCFNDC